MSDTTYNGWSNYPTWAVALHINNDQGWQESVHEALREADPTEGRDDIRLAAAQRAGQIIRDNVDETLYDLCGPGAEAPKEGLAADLFRFSFESVDWTEIGASFLADLTERD